MEIEHHILLNTPLVEFAPLGLQWVKRGEVMVSDGQGELVHDCIYTAYRLVFEECAWEMAVMDKSLVWLYRVHQRLEFHLWPKEYHLQIPDWGLKERLDLQELQMNLLQLTELVYEEWGGDYRKAHQDILESLE